MPSRSTRTAGIIVAALGLVAVVLAIVLLLRPADDGAPSAGTPSVGTASAGTASEAPAAAPASVDCDGDRTATVPLSLSWETSGGASARLAVGTTDATGGDPVDLAETDYTAVTADCRDSETLITLAVRAPDGTTAQRTLVLPTS